MKKIFSLIVMFLAVAASFAAPNKYGDKLVAVSPFTQIEIKGSLKVYFTQGDETKVKITGLESAIDNVMVEQKGETLVLDMRGTNVNSFGDVFRAIKNSAKDETVVIYVTSPDLIGVTLTGSGDFKSKSLLDTDNLSLSLLGSGDIELGNIVCDNLRVELKGSGDVDIDRVECVTSMFVLRGSGDIEVKQHNVRRTDIELVGSGDVEVKCTNCDVVNASIKGSGDIKLTGNIKDINRSVRGSGDIIVR